MARPRRIFTRIILAAVILGLAGGAVFVFAPGNRPGAVARQIANAIAGKDQTIGVPKWLSERLLGMVNARLRPQLAFAEIAYKPPYTITLTDATLETPEGERIIEVQTLVITLAERPTEGEPLRFAGISFDSGSVRLIAIEAGPDGGGLAGFSRMTRARPGSTPTPAGRQAKQPSGEQEIGALFSDAIELRDVVLRDFVLEYIGPGNATPIRLDNIDAEMDIQPDAGEGTGKGWYTIGFTSGRAPGFELGIEGRLNLDTLDAEIRELTASIDAGPETMGSLPDTLAEILRGSDVRGRISATGSARANLKNITSGSAELTVNGTDLNAALGEYHLPIDALQIATSVEAGILAVEPIDLDIHGGRVSVTGESSLNQTGMPFDAAWSIDSLQLADLLRSQPAPGVQPGGAPAAAPAAAPPNLAGTLNGSGNVQTLLSDIRGGLSGRGSVVVKDGRLLVLPGLSQLAAMVSGKDPSTDKISNHRGTATFTLAPDAATITNSEVVTNLVAARGTGTVAFDKTLDLRVNAGPLEKLQSLLGPIGDLFGSVTDRLLKYTIKGTMDDPKVGVAPLGLD